MPGNLPARAQKGETSHFTQAEALRGATFDTSTLVTRRGLLLPKQMSFDKWVGVGSYLSSIFSSSAWCLGDWLVYGETTFNGRYNDAIKLTSLDYQTLRNHAWVARRFPMSRRRDTLSFTHHAEVAALSEPEQDFWLRKAEEYAWSAKRLRREVKASLRERAADSDEEAGGSSSAEGGDARSTEDTVMLSVSISADCLESCHAAASRLGLGVETWASQTLLAAAAQTSGEKSQQDRLPAGGHAQERSQHDPAVQSAEDDHSQARQQGGAVHVRGRAEHGSVRRSVPQVQ